MNWWKVFEFVYIWAAFILLFWVIVSIVCFIFWELPYIVHPFTIRAVTGGGLVITILDKITEIK